MNAIKLAEAIKSSKESFDYVIGVVRGGNVVASILSDLLNTDLIAIKLKAYKGTKLQGQAVLYDEPCVELRGKRILVVDDVCDTGSTFKVLSSYLKLRGVDEMKFAVLVKKRTCDFNINYWSLEDDRWILFPWEILEIYNQDPEGVKEAVREGMDNEVATRILGFIESTGKT
ncbi:phosphoribosyltransferase [Ignicoccus islandicus]|uniref:phosphoribosyltransferase n=1 Tax=Ignicoccus islandicus TaxID=54259 RepID=UPI00143A2DF4|nr:phosphoribosyltransferase family protein [Ignicoccus islandicus]